jgi:ubiquinone/menaquinone biosynthesis C-methylase UbiE
VSSQHRYNQSAWDERVRNKRLYTRPATEEDFVDPLKAMDPCGWLGGNVRGKRLLCLASGGGRQSALYAAAGAEVTVVDLSGEMLELDREVAKKRGLYIRIVQTSMDDLSLLADASFEVVVQPVSTCYVPDLVAVYREVARVTSPGGLYISQHKQPGSLQSDVVASDRGYVVNTPYYMNGPLPPVIGNYYHRESDTIEYLHTWESLIGSLCKSGFVVEDLMEPRHGKPTAEKGSFAHRSAYLPPFVKIKARRLANVEKTPNLWVP